MSNKRKGYMRISPEFLHRALGLPKDAEIVGMHIDTRFLYGGDPDVLLVKIISPSFPEVPAGQITPEVVGTWKERPAVDGDRIAELIEFNSVARK